MSQENVELALPRNLLEGGSYVGPDGARRALADAAETWEEVRVAIEATHDTDDRVVVLARTVNASKEGGPRMEYEAAYLMKMGDGKLLHLRPFPSHAEPLKGTVGVGEFRLRLSPTRGTCWVSVGFWRSPTRR